MKKTLALLLALIMVAALMVPTAVADDGMEALIEAIGRLWEDVL